MLIVANLIAFARHLKDCNVTIMKEILKYHSLRTTIISKREFFNCLESIFLHFTLLHLIILNHLKDDSRALSAQIPK